MSYGLRVRGVSPRFGTKPELPLGVPRVSRCYIYVVACVSSLFDPNPRGAKPELPPGVFGLVGGIYVVACASSLSDPNPRGVKPELPLGMPRASWCYLRCGVCEQSDRLGGQYSPTEPGDPNPIYLLRVPTSGRVSELADSGVSKPAELSDTARLRPGCGILRTMAHLSRLRGWWWSR